MKDVCLIPGGLHTPPERAKGISDDAIWAMQKSAEAIVVDEKGVLQFCDVR